MLDERDLSISSTLCDLALLPLRLAAVPLMAGAPPEAREHLRAAFRETRAAAHSLMPRLRRRGQRSQAAIVVE